MKKINKPTSDRSPACRQHFGEGIFFRYQSLLFALESSWRRKFGRMAQNGNGHSLSGKMLSLAGRLKALPFAKPKEVTRHEFYLDFGRPYWGLEIRHNSRPAVVSSPGETLTAEATLPADAVLRFGIGLLETTDRSALEGNLLVTLRIFDGAEPRSISFRFLLNKKFRRTFEAFYEFGRNWADTFTELAAEKGEKLRVEMSASFEKENQLIPVAPSPCIAWSGPQIIVRRPDSKAKKIIILLYEAMTDPLFLEQKFATKINMPHYRNLLSESLNSSSSYSQNDSTLGSVGTILTGLYSSQHGISDYRSNAEIYDTPTLSSSILTLPEVLKKKGFLTIGGGTTSRLKASYGWSRGFDSFVNVTPPWADTVPNEDWAKRALESMRGHDSFLFLYLDWLHWPTITFAHGRSPACHPTSLLQEASTASQSPALYFDRLGKLDERLGDLIAYLRGSGQYDNTLLFVTGDHGSYLEPWGYHERYAFYEHHIRVPSVVKKPDWADGLSRVSGAPFKASTNIMSTTLQCLGEAFPDYEGDFPQLDGMFDNMSITETVMHPKPEDYALALISRQFKYVLFAKVDWAHAALKALEGNRLYQIDTATSLVDESTDVAAHFPDVCRDMQERAARFIGSNLEFRRRHPAKHFRTNDIGWSPKKIGPIKKGLSRLNGRVSQWLR